MVRESDIFGTDKRGASCGLDPNDPIRAIGLQRGRGHATTPPPNLALAGSKLAVGLTVGAPTVKVGSGAHSGGSHCESWQWGWQWEPPL
jgi:hypothetical protein